MLGLQMSFLVSWAFCGHLNFQHTNQLYVRNLWKITFTPIL